MSDAAVAPRRTTVEEYLTLDAKAEQGRYEYLDGHVRMLAGATPDHNLIKDNIRSELHPEIAPRGCRSFTSDQRVRLSETHYVYPDVVVVCNEPQYTDESPPSLVNPELIVEVLSPSTAKRDQQDKLDAYLGLDTLQEYWIVSPEKVILTQYVRQGDDWIVRSFRDRDATLRCEALDLDLSLGALYTLVDPASASEDASDAEG
jgi:Uma2 family endonuclease